MRESGGLWKIIFLSITLPLLFFEFKFDLFQDFPRIALVFSLVFLNLMDGVSTRYFVERLGVEYEDNRTARWMLMKNPVAVLLVATVNNFYFGAQGKQKIPLHNYENPKKRP